MLFEMLLLSLSSIRRNVLRSVLTLLGVVIGVGAVIAMVTLGNGATAQVRAEMASLGGNLLFVRPGQFGPGRSSAEARPFDARDLEALRSQLRGARAVAPVAQASARVIAGSESRNVQVIGTDNDWLVAQDVGLAAGRAFLPGELRGGRGVCIVGQTLREELFGPQPATGRRVRVGGVSCEVIGRLEERGETSFGTDRDDVALMPLRAFQRRIAGNDDIRTFYVLAGPGTDTGDLQDDIARLLRERRGIAPGEEDDFAVADMAQIAEAQTATTALLTVLLGAVAGVSLLVGGIGIMNIMLVSVTERTREIGIRLAVGAQQSQVLMQFLVEAVTLSVIGGVIGVATGLGFAFVATGRMGVPFLPDPQIVALAFGFSAV
ncbi:MAG: ABC transporter permease, partial [Pseudomonadota bacterium]